LIRWSGQRVLPSAIEPICKLESNIINTAGEGLQLVKAADRENIKLLVDYYHLVMEKEDPEFIVHAGSYIKHTHFATLQCRTYSN